MKTSKRITYTTLEFPEATRTSDIHEYSFVTAGLYDWQKSIDQAEKADYSRYEKDYDIYERDSRGVAGEEYREYYNKMWHTFKFREDQILRGKEFVKRYGYSRQTYAAEMKRVIIDQLVRSRDKQSAKGSILQWHRSHSAALKASAGYRSKGYLNVRLVECVVK